MEYPSIGLTNRRKHSAKACAQRAPTLAHYDFTKRIIVQADASSYGLGGVLIQEDGENNREIVAYSSRTLTACETRYSQIEKEALALVFATDRFKDYIVGIEITLKTDHRPLTQILQTKHLDKLTPKLQGMRMRLMRYTYSVVYVPGKQLILADSLSRNPSKNKETKEINISEDLDVYLNFIVKSLPAIKNILERIRTQQETDYTCLRLKQYCTSKWPSKNNLAAGLLPYYQHKDEISYCKGYLLFGSRLIIPPPLQLEMLKKIHEGHLGISKCRDRAKQSVWWIGLSTQLANLIENCPRVSRKDVIGKNHSLKKNFQIDHGKRSV